MNERLTGEETPLTPEAAQEAEAETKIDPLSEQEHDRLLALDFAVIKARMEIKGRRSFGYVSVPEFLPDSEIGPKGFNEEQWREHEKKIEEYASLRSRSLYHELRGAPPIVVWHSRPSWAKSEQESRESHPIFPKLSFEELRELESMEDQLQRSLRERSKSPISPLTHRVVEPAEYPEGFKAERFAQLKSRAEYWERLGLPAAFFIEQEPGSPSLPL